MTASGIAARDYSARADVAPPAGAPALSEMKTFSVDYNASESDQA